MFVEQVGYPPFLQRTLATHGTPSPNFPLLFSTVAAMMSMRRLLAEMHSQDLDPSEMKKARNSLLVAVLK